MQPSTNSGTLQGRSDVSIVRSRKQWEQVLGVTGCKCVHTGVCMDSDDSDNEHGSF